MPELYGIRSCLGYLTTRHTHESSTNTGRTLLIRSHSSAKFSFEFELSGNLNYNIKLLLYPLMFDQIIGRFERKLRINRVRINCVRPVMFLTQTELSELI